MVPARDIGTLADIHPEKRVNHDDVDDQTSIRCLSAPHRPCDRTKRRNRSERGNSTILTGLPTSSGSNLERAAPAASERTPPPHWCLCRRCPKTSPSHALFAQSHTSSRNVSMMRTAEFERHLDGDPSEISAAAVIPLSATRHVASAQFQRAGRGRYGDTESNLSAMPIRSLCYCQHGPHGGWWTHRSTCRWRTYVVLILADSTSPPCEGSAGRWKPPFRIRFPTLGCPPPRRDRYCRGSPDGSRPA